MTITHNMPMADYLALNALGSGTAFKAITQSPHHARYDQQYPSHAKEADIGTVAHKLLLEGNNDGIEIIDALDWRTKAAKESRDAAYAAGKTPILQSKMESVERMVDAVRSFVEKSEIAGCFDNGKPETTVTADEFGIQLKARPDWLSDRWHVSLKTTDGSAEPNAFLRGIFRSMGYGFGLTYYHRVLQFNGIDVRHVILTIEQNAPYGCSLVSLDPAMWAYEETRVERAIQLLAQCKESGVYPCYPSHICYAEPKPWEMDEAESQDDAASSKWLTHKELDGGIPA